MASSLLLAETFGADATRPDFGLGRPSTSGEQAPDVGKPKRKEEL